VFVIEWGRWVAENDLYCWWMDSLFYAGMEKLAHPEYSLSHGKVLRVSLYIHREDIEVYCWSYA
jgi:hypothetical protein